MHPGEKQEVPGGHPGRGVRGQGREESRGVGGGGGRTGPSRDGREQGAAGGVPDGASADQGREGLN